MSLDFFQRYFAYNLSLFSMAVRISGVTHGFFAILCCFRFDLFWEKIISLNHSLWLKNYLCHNYFLFLLWLFRFKDQLKASPHVLEKIVV